MLDSLALYIHWPFCVSKCPYCDFNSHVAAAIDQHAWLDAYRTEIARAAAETGGRMLRSIFFGGGTPSLMAPEVVAGVIAAAADGWRFANDIEITLEANPGSVERGRFAAYAEAGVNRLSMGVQALNDDDLRRLGRAMRLWDQPAHEVVALRTGHSREVRQLHQRLFYRPLLSTTAAPPSSLSACPPASFITRMADSRATRELPW